MKLLREIFVIEKTNQNLDDLSLRISELKDSINHYKNDIIVVIDRTIEFQGLKNQILKKKKRIGYYNKNMKHNFVRCDVCKIDIHRASYSRQSKSKKRLKNISQNKAIVPRKQVVREENKVLDIDIKDKNLY